MEALTLNSMRRKGEAFELIKKALFKNLKNFTCWHVFGILHRSNKYFFNTFSIKPYRNYEDAKKAYANALKYDPNNQNVLRDLGQLQI